MGYLKAFIIRESEKKEEKTLIFDIRTEYRYTKVNRPKFQTSVHLSVFTDKYFPLFSYKISPQPD
jgi:hypothetical protein